MGHPPSKAADIKWRELLLTASSKAGGQGWPHRWNPEEGIASPRRRTMEQRGLVSALVGLGVALAQHLLATLLLQLF